MHGVKEQFNVAICLRSTFSTYRVQQTWAPWTAAEETPRRGRASRAAAPCLVFGRQQLNIDEPGYNHSAGAQLVHGEGATERYGEGPKRHPPLRRGTFATTHETWRPRVAGPLARARIVPNEPFQGMP